MLTLFVRNDLFLPSGVGWCMTPIPMRCSHKVKIRRERSPEWFKWIHDHESGAGGRALTCRLSVSVPHRSPIVA